MIARKAGYTLQEIDDLDIFYLLDLLTTQANLALSKKEEQSKPKVRKATQADFDAL